MGTKVEIKGCTISNGKTAAVSATPLQAQGPRIDIHRSRVIEPHASANVGKRVGLLVVSPAVVERPIARHLIIKGVDVRIGPGVVEGAVVEEEIVGSIACIVAPGGIASIHCAST